MKRPKWSPGCFGRSISGNVYLHCWIKEQGLGELLHCEVQICVRFYQTDWSILGDRCGVTVGVDIPEGTRTSEAIKHRY